VIRPRFEFGHDSEIGTEEAASEFGDQFLARAFASILVIAAEVAVGTMRGGRPMDLDRDRGTSRDATPPTPPGIRVRTTAVRSS
jgi:hypothetical protein